MVMTDHKRRLRSSEEMMAGFPKERGGSQTGYESRLASLAMEITRMNVSDREFLRSLFSSGPAQNLMSPRKDMSSSANTSRVAVPTHSSPQATLSQIPALTHCATLVPPKFSIFLGEGQKHESSYPQWRSEIHSVWSSDLYKESMVLSNTRRSLRGRAADVLLAMGSDISVEQVLQNLTLGLGVFGHVIELWSSSSLQGNCLLSLCLFGDVD